MASHGILVQVWIKLLAWLLAPLIVFPLVQFTIAINQSVPQATSRHAYFVVQYYPWCNLLIAFISYTLLLSLHSSGYLDNRFWCQARGIIDCQRFIQEARETWSSRDWFEATASSRRTLSSSQVEIWQLNSFSFCIL